MKQLFLLFLLAISTNCLGQYVFKYSTQSIGIESINESSTTRGGGYKTKTYKNNLGDTLTVEPIIALTLKENSNLNSIISPYSNKLSFKEQLGNVYYLSCNTTNSDEVLDLVTQLCKNDDITECDAVHQSNFKYHNTLYQKQYYLRTGINLGINAEAAWNLVPKLGDKIVVAVIDEGVDHNHEDLPNVLDGYTVGITNGKGNPTSSTKAHGIACAGIIGAANNNIGIRGIASNVRILPVNISPGNEFSNDLEIAKAIRWTSERADILSCSWGGNGSESVSISEAIKDAVAKGRNGKGCTIIFSAGNYAQYFPNTIEFPANMKEVISVGAIDKNGKLWNYSQYGEGLCLVAPSGDGNSSSDIVTTDRMGSLGYNNSNYTVHFSGTSAACPQVAGIAALILSARPDLNASEVKNALLSTATDLGTKGYDTKYGYGLVNAYKAISKIALAIEETNKNTYSIHNLPLNANVTWEISPQKINDIKISTRGQGNSICALELNTDKTQQTTLYAKVIINTDTINISKEITLLGRFWGTYSIPAISIDGNILPAINNKEFGPGYPIFAYPAATITATSYDFPFYTAELSGNDINYWQYDGYNTIKFSFPYTAPIKPAFLDFTNILDGTKVRVLAVPLRENNRMQLSQIGSTLNIVFPLDNTFYNEKKSHSSNNSWSLEIINIITGAKQENVNITSNSYQTDVTNWKKGLYLIRAIYKHQYFTNKIYIN